MAKLSNQKKSFSEFHKDNTGKTVPRNDFHNDKQSYIKGQGNLVCGNIFTHL